MFKNGLSIGIAPRFINQVSSDRTLNALEVQEKRKQIFKKTSWNEGFDLDVDLGLGYGIAVGEKWELRLGAVGKHLRDGPFSRNLGLFNDNPDSTPPRIGRRLDLGVALEGPNVFSFFTPKVVFDLKNLGLMAGDRNQIWLKTHFGSELKVEWTKGLGGAFRAGLNQGYPTAGINGYFSIFTLDLAYYTEELGGYPGQIPDKRYAIQMGLEI
jgi:hypothetical protein